MRDHSTTTFLLAAILLSIPAISSSVDRPTYVPTGDQMGTLQSFDPARRTVMLHAQAVALSPPASAALQRQLADQGRSYGMPFPAKFSVTRDMAGHSVIQSIYVFPPRRR